VPYGNPIEIYFGLVYDLFTIPGTSEIDVRGSLTKTKTTTGTIAACPRRQETSSLPPPLLLIAL